jgi:hypothetical protein
VDPTQVEQRVQLADQMISRNNLVELKLVEKLALSTRLPSHHRTPPRIAAPSRANHGSIRVSTIVLQQNPRQKRTLGRAATPGLLMTRSRHLHKPVNRANSPPSKKKPPFNFALAMMMMAIFDLDQL